MLKFKAIAWNELTINERITSHKSDTHHYSNILGGEESLIFPAWDEALADLGVETGREQVRRQLKTSYMILSNSSVPYDYSIGYLIVEDSSINISTDMRWVLHQLEPPRNHQ